MDGTTPYSSRPPLEPAPAGELLRCPRPFRRSPAGGARPLLPVRTDRGTAEGGKAEGAGGGGGCRRAGRSPGLAPAARAPAAPHPGRGRACASSPGRGRALRAARAALALQPCLRRRPAPSRLEPAAAAARSLQAVPPAAAGDPGWGERSWRGCCWFRWVLGGLHPPPRGGEPSCCGGAGSG